MNLPPPVAIYFFAYSSHTPTFAHQQDVSNIDHMYQQVLEVMAIPDAARDQMMQQSPESKWKQICLHKNHIRSNESVCDLCFCHEITCGSYEAIILIPVLYWINSFYATYLLCLNCLFLTCAISTNRKPLNGRSASTTIHSADCR